MNHGRKCFLYLTFIFLFLGLSQSAFSQKASQTQRGTASWYGGKFHGKPTSSGERYNKNKMTAAHNGLPFGTKVKVTNLANDKYVVLRINDRGGFKGPRIIDVSEAAAKKLDFISHGLGKVKVEVLEWPEDRSLAAASPIKSDAYVIQAGTFAKPEYAQELKQKLKKHDQDVTIELIEDRVNGRRVHRIEAGHFESRRQAEQFNEILSEEGFNGIVRGV